MHTFVLAGGCFWCLDAVYRTLRGVKDVVSGYTGGVTVNPDYDAVCTGMTGHAEAVAVTFDPEVIPDEVILDVFFSLHDPRQLNRQGNDVGTQYRSAMFYEDDEQKALFEAARDRAAEYWDGGIVTTLEPLGDCTAPRSTTRTSSRRTLARATAWLSRCRRSTRSASRSRSTCSPPSPQAHNRRPTPQAGSAGFFRPPREPTLGASDPGAASRHECRAGVRPLLTDGAS